MPLGICSRSPCSGLMDILFLKSHTWQQWDNFRSCCMTWQCTWEFFIVQRRWDTKDALEIILELNMYSTPITMVCLTAAVSNYYDDGLNSPAGVCRRLAPLHSICLDSWEAQPWAISTTIKHWMRILIGSKLVLSKGQYFPQPKWLVTWSGTTTWPKFCQ